MKRVMIIMGLAGVLVLAGARIAWPQTKQLFNERPVTVACFQNGVQIFTLGPLKSFAQVGEQRSVEYIQVDENPGQIRVIGTATCVLRPAS